MISEGDYGEEESSSISNSQLDESFPSHVKPKSEYLHRKLIGLEEPDAEEIEKYNSHRPMLAEDDTQNSSLIKREKASLDIPKGKAGK